MPTRTPSPDPSERADLEVAILASELGVPIVRAAGRDLEDAQSKGDPASACGQDAAPDGDDRGASA
ncbi:hypothetical protein [Rubrivirga sp.]|uniref:hypothetical protein n=1 Tax=Rubrivirga sp. TaxID=1885344 RepID=UPI003C773277